MILIEDDDDQLPVQYDEDNDCILFFMMYVLEGIIF